VNGDYASTGNYFADYPSDIDIVGVSMNTMIPYGVAFQGEVAGRLGQPIQIDDAEFLFSSMAPLDPTLAALQGLPEGTPIFGNSQVVKKFGAPGFNEVIRGFQRKDMLQAQATVTKVWGPTLGTDQIVFLCEVGATWFFDMEDKDELRYEGAGTSTSGNPWFTEAGIQPYTTTSGFADSFSWGYRLVMRLDFYNAIGSLTLQPIAAWYQDVEGTTPRPISNFIAGRKQLTVGLIGTYLNFLNASVRYTMYMGAGQFNQLHDRDFLSISTSMSF